MFDVGKGEELEKIPRANKVCHVGVIPQSEVIVATFGSPAQRPE